MLPKNTFIERAFETFLVNTEDDDDTPMYEIEEITERRKKDGKSQCKVLWVGGESTWEFASTLCEDGVFEALAVV